MKKLSLVEHILVTVSTVLILCAFAFSYLIDESAGVPGLLTYGTIFSVLGVFMIVLALCVGFGLYLSKDKGTVKTVGVGMLLAANVVVFAASSRFLIAEDMSGLGSVSADPEAISISMILGFIGAIVYFIALILWGLRAFAGVSTKGDSHDPDNDEKIQSLIKWHGLLEDGIITEEEYQTKRAAILGIETKPVKKKDDLTK